MRTQVHEFLDADSAVNGILLNEGSTVVTAVITVDQVNLHAYGPDVLDRIAEAATNAARDLRAAVAAITCDGCGKTSTDLRPRTVTINDERYEHEQLRVCVDCAFSGEGADLDAAPVDVDDEIDSERPQAVAS